MSIYRQMTSDGTQNVGRDKKMKATLCEILEFQGFVRVCRTSNERVIYWFID